MGYIKNTKSYLTKKMKAIIFACLIAFAASQAVQTPSDTCWASDCINPWANYSATHARRLQAAVKIPQITDAECKADCYDKCYCEHTAKDIPLQRRTQAVVNWGYECNKKCGGGGTRRLQAVVTYRKPVCQQRCFNICYRRKLKQKLKTTSSRRTQAVMSPEQLAAAECAVYCKQSTGELISPNPGHQCVKECVCK